MTTSRNPFDDLPPPRRVSGSVSVWERMAMSGVPAEEVVALGRAMLAASEQGHTGQTLCDVVNSWLDDKGLGRLKIVQYSTINRHLKSRPWERLADD